MLEISADEVKDGIKTCLTCRHGAKILDHKNCRQCNLAPKGDFPGWAPSGDPSEWGLCLSCEKYWWKEEMTQVQGGQHLCPLCIKNMDDPWEMCEPGPDFGGDAA